MTTSGALVASNRATASRFARRITGCGPDVISQADVSW